MMSQVAQTSANVGAGILAVPNVTQPVTDSDKIIVINSLALTPAANPPIVVLMITSDELKQRLHYDPESGVFTWLPGGGPRARGIAGTVYSNQRGTYRNIRVLGEVHGAHRLAYLYMTGGWPPEFIDHINGNGLDNRWENLRAATRSQNLANRQKPTKSKSGFKGVQQISPHSWQASIRKDNKSYYLGLFTSPEEAHEAYKAAARELHGEFASSV